jgi:hypothetical protein
MSQNIKEHKPYEQLVLSCSESLQAFAEPDDIVTSLSDLMATYVAKAEEEPVKGIHRIYNHYNLLVSYLSAINEDNPQSILDHNAAFTEPLEIFYASKEKFSFNTNTTPNGKA